MQFIKQSQIKRIIATTNIKKFFGKKQSSISIIYSNIPNIHDMMYVYNTNHSKKY